MKKLVSYFILLAVTAFLAWYFFVKEHHFKIQFNAKQSSGILFRYIEDANFWKSEDIDSVVNTDKVHFKSISQKYYIKDSVISIRWEMEPIHDSLVIVSAYLKDEKNNLSQKLKVPFIKTDIVKRTVASIKDLRNGLKEFQRRYRVSKVQEATIPGKHYLYLSFKSETKEKANHMMEGNGLVMNYLFQNKLTLDGYPFLKTTKWDPITGELNFDFCFPIKETDHQPTNPALKTASIKEQKALQVIYNGNYRISDRAWYTILDYKDKHGIDLDALPIEVYYNDPHSGSKDTEWRTDIFMPIKKH